MAILENTSSARVDAFRREQLLKAKQATWVFAFLLAIPSILFLPVERESPEVYWSFFGLTLMCVGALITSVWRDARRRCRANAPQVNRSQLLTIETWKQISAMTEDEYMKLLRRAQTLDTARRVGRSLAKPAARLGRAAFNIAVGGDLSSALDTLDYVEGNH